MTYNFTDLQTTLMVPSSRIIVQKNGLPLMFNSTGGSNVSGRFKTDSIQDANLKIQDRVSKIETISTEEKTLGTRLIERTWTEKISRAISIKNETGRLIKHIVIEANDDPANKISYQDADPAPTEINLPAHIWKFSLDIDEEKKINLNLHYSQKEQIKIEPKEVQQLQDFANVNDQNQE